MRQIKFRGKAIMSEKQLNELGIKHNNGWVYGNLIQYKSITFIVGEVVEWSDEWWCKVKPDTVGQYTGWNDKNGKEIYEDDLVQVLDYASWEWEGLYKVVWDEESLMYVLVDAYGDKEKMCEFEHYLVRGNIYENPELLRGDLG